MAYDAQAYPVPSLQPGEPARSTRRRSSPTGRLPAQLARGRGGRGGGAVAPASDAARACWAGAVPSRSRRPDPKRRRRRAGLRRAPPPNARPGVTIMARAPNGRTRLTVPHVPRGDHHGALRSFLRAPVVLSRKLLYVFWCGIRYLNIVTKRGAKIFRPVVYCV